MTLAIRKLALVALIGGVFVVANALVISKWLSDAGIIEAAITIRKEFLTGTAITVIVALLILLVGPGQLVAGLRRRCSVCGHGQLSGKYCSDCGSKI